MVMDIDTNLSGDLDQLKALIADTKLPPELQEKISGMLDRLMRSVKYGGYSEEFERTKHYLDWLSKIPWTTYSPDTIDIHQAQEILNKHHYGLQDVKERILEYLAVIKLNQQTEGFKAARAPILLLVGLVGTGKTTFAYALAEAMGRKVARIPFGGMGSARDLRGQSRLHLESEPGYVVKALSRAGTMNPIILLDEIDRVAETARTDIMGVLVELLDPEQNNQFTDHFIDYPLDLSQVIFIGTANNTANIATAVMDRMEPLAMPSYTDEEKIAIARTYLLPKALKETALPEHVLRIDEALWPQIVRPLGYDSGIRTLQRTIQGIVRKTAKQFVQKEINTVFLDSNNIKAYLPSYKTELI
jgi:ATP-dependent Lon protease